MKQAQFDKLMKLAPCPVRFWGNNSCYIVAPPPENVIFIDNRLRTQVSKVFELTHEIGHAVCHTQGCRCLTDVNVYMMTQQHTLAEYHAMQFTIRHIKGNPALIRLFVKYIKEALQLGIVPGHTNCYYRAAKRITKLKQWQRFNLTQPAK